MIGCANVWALTMKSLTNIKQFTIGYAKVAGISGKNSSNADI